MPTTLESLVNRYPFKMWDWGAMSRNLAITPDFIAANLDKPWSWGWLSQNPIITPDFIAANPDLPLGLGVVVQ